MIFTFLTFFDQNGSNFTKDIDTLKLTFTDNHQFLKRFIKVHKIGVNRWQ